MALVLSFHLQTQTGWSKKLRQVMFLKTFMKTKVCLALEIILNIRDFMNLLIKKDCKIEDEFRGKIIREFVGLKSKMYSLVMVDGGKLKE